MAKRLYRQLDSTIKSKISQSLKGKPKSDMVKRKISQSMTEYWKTIGNKPQPLTMDEYLNGDNNRDKSN